MSAEAFIARRYLRPRFNLVTFISFISIGGIAVGTAALIVVLSVFNGFSGVVRNLLVGFDPHIRIIPRSGVMIDADSLSNWIRSRSDIVGAAPFISGRSAAIYREGIRVVQIRGIRGRDVRTTTGLDSSMRSGTFVDDDPGIPHPIVLGAELSLALNAGIGDTIALLSQNGLEESLTQFGQPVIIRCTVTGIFQSQNKEYDAFWAYTNQPTARKLFAMEAGAMGVDVRVADFEQSHAVAEELRTVLGPSYLIETWQDLHSDLFAVMELERWAAFIILSLIIIVAVFNVLGSLTMTVIEKVRDIGIMKTMGLADGGVQRIFMYKGLMIGGLGTSFGLASGTTICWLQATYGFYRLRTGYFIIPALPVDMRAIDILLVATTALVLAAVAALYPSRRASRVVPAEAVRWE